MGPLLVAAPPAFASPVPVQVIKGTSETAVGLGAREVSADRGILPREGFAFAERGVNLFIFARENKIFEGVGVPFLIPRACLTRSRRLQVTGHGEKDATRNINRSEPGRCTGRLRL